VVAFGKDSQGRSDFEVKQLDQKIITSFKPRAEVIAGI
jgi:hypothetical protein